MSRVYSCLSLFYHIGQIFDIECIYFSAAVLMNNLNDPHRSHGSIHTEVVTRDVRLNKRIRPGSQGDGGGDSSKWNYALGWIWSKESQKEIEAAKIKYEKTIKIIQKDLNVKYRQTLSENRRETAQLELDLEKEKQRVHGYHQTLASQSRQLEEERRGMRLEREALENKRSRLHYNERERRASLDLKDVEYRLVERQRAFCSILVPHARRVEMEKDLLTYIAKGPSGSYCQTAPSCISGDGGRLMWLYLRYWKLQLTLQSHQRAEAAMLGTQTKE
uniref:Coiled-coil domain containing 127b n=1 Tax=Sinocyclocheilus grahami TaxID=75366 RepID=A0A672LF23_SINGR